MNQLITLDIDGTLYEYKKGLRWEVDVHPDFKDYIKKSNNVHILASGRHLHDMIDVYEALGMNTPIVSCDGALVTHKDKVIFAHPLLPLPHSVFDKEGCKYSTTTGESGIGKLTADVDYVMVSLPLEIVTPEVQKYAEAFCRYYVWDNSLTIYPYGVTKADGISRLNGIHVAHYGDSHNDVEAWDNAQHAYVVPTHHPNLQLKDKYQILQPRPHAVYYHLKHLSY